MDPSEDAGPGRWPITAVAHMVGPRALLFALCALASSGWSGLISGYGLLMVEGVL